MVAVATLPSLGFRKLMLLLTVVAVVGLGYGFIKGTLEAIEMFGQASTRLRVRLASIKEANISTPGKTSAMHETLTQFAAVKASNVVLVEAALNTIDPKREHPLSGTEDFENWKRKVKDGAAQLIGNYSAARDPHALSVWISAETQGMGEYEFGEFSPKTMQAALIASGTTLIDDLDSVLRSIPTSANAERKAVLNLAAEAGLYAPSAERAKSFFLNYLEQWTQSTDRLSEPEAEQLRYVLNQYRRLESDDQARESYLASLQSRPAYRAMANE